MADGENLPPNVLFHFMISFKSQRDSLGERVRWEK